jgi:hypothetical protein
MYCEEAELAENNAMLILSAARRYKVHPLITRCLEFIAAIISPSNVCSLLSQCVEFDETSLVDTCSQFIGNSTAAVLSSESFTRASAAVVRRIAGLETLSVGEIDLFEACVAWARVKSDSCSPEQLRRHLSPLLELIRFPTMSPEDFARRVVPLNILTDSEACNVYKYFTCPEKPPKRFITVKRKKPANASTTNKVVPASAADDNVVNSRLYPDVENLRLSGASPLIVPTAPDILPDYDHSDLPPKYEM